MYLIMNLELTEKTKATIKIDEYFERIINEFPMNISKSYMALPAARIFSSLNVPVDSSIVFKTKVVMIPTTDFVINSDKEMVEYQGVQSLEFMIEKRKKLFSYC